MLGRGSENAGWIRPEHPQNTKPSRVPKDGGGHSSCPRAAGVVTRAVERHQGSFPLTSHSTRSQAVWLLGQEGWQRPGPGSKARHQRRRRRPQKENIPGEGEARVWKTGEELGRASRVVGDGEGRHLTVLGGHGLDGKSTREPKSFYRVQDQTGFLEAGREAWFSSRTLLFLRGWRWRDSPPGPAFRARQGPGRFAPSILSPLQDVPSRLIPNCKTSRLLPQIPQPSGGPGSPAR